MMASGKRERKRSLTDRSQRDQALTLPGPLSRALRIGIQLGLNLGLSIKPNQEVRNV